MKPTFSTISPKILIGLSRQMSIVNEQTKQLWQEFGPARKNIEHIIGTDSYSVEIYPADYFQQFDPAKVFEKWAALEVSELESIPEGMQKLIIPKGEYAVFTYQGAAAGAPGFYQYIYGEWIPTSDYDLDDRPHFAVMGQNYDPLDPDSEEKIWIPVKLK